MAKRRKRRKKKKQDLISKEVKSSVFGLLMIALAILIIISFFEKGKLLIFINHFLINYFGFATIILPFSFICLGLFLLQVKAVWSRFSAFLGSFLLFFSVLFLFKQGELGLNFFNNIADLISVFGAYVVFIVFFIIANLITFNVSFEKIFAWLKAYRLKLAMKKKEMESDQNLIYQEDQNVKNSFMSKLKFDFESKQKKFDFDKNNDDDNQSLSKQDNDKNKKDKIVKQDEKQNDGLNKIKILKKDLTKDSDLAKVDETIKPVVISQAEKKWEYPPLSIFENTSGGEAHRGDIKQNATIIEKTLDSFGVRAKVVEVNKGPSVTQYGLEISMGTKLSKIRGLATDLALALAAPTGQIRIEAPIAGRSLVGIEVPNQKAAYVTLKEMLKKKESKDHSSKLAVSLGIDVGGNPIIADIAKMPHVLIAGATGSGKSVGLNAFLCSILFRASPDEVKLILVDPKRVELTLYNNIPHLYCPVIVDTSKVVSALKWAVNEMNNRYKKLEEAGVKNIDSYNNLAQETAMPKIVIVLDEFADIMLFAPSEVEESITRLAQMSRAVGIHLVLATQRPSVNVITGLIKANIPTRIAFNVSSMMDSRVILDSAGAEKLLGNGDMFYIPPDSSKPTRIQGTYVSDKDIHSLIGFLKNESYPVDYEAEITSKFKVSKSGKVLSGSDDEEKDDRFDEAVQLLAQYEKASSSFLQRRLSVGYSRAARILDQLFASGLVGPANGSKPREINKTKLMEYLSKTENE